MKLSFLNRPQTINELTVEERKKIISYLLNEMSKEHYNLLRLWVGLLFRG